MFSGGLQNLILFTFWAPHLGFPWLHLGTPLFMDPQLHGHGCRGLVSHNDCNLKLSSDDIFCLCLNIICARNLSAGSTILKFILLFCQGCW